MITPVEASAKRRDPKIQSFTYLQLGQLNLRNASVAVFPFDVEADAERPTEDFGRALQRVLMETKAVAEVAYFPRTPWADLPEWRRRELTIVDLAQLAAAEAAAEGLDYVILGSVDQIFRTTEHGLVAQVTIRILDLNRFESPPDQAALAPVAPTPTPATPYELVWYGTKKADWVRRFPTSDCLLKLASTFVIDWVSPLTSKRR